MLLHEAESLVDVYPKYPAFTVGPLEGQLCIAQFNKDQQLIQHHGLCFLEGRAHLPLNWGFDFPDLDFKHQSLKIMLSRKMWNVFSLKAASFYQTVMCAFM